MMGPEAFTETLLADVLRASQAYAAGMNPERPTLIEQQSPGWRQQLISTRERARDRLERAAGRFGFSRTHFDPGAAAAAFTRLIELSPGLARTYERLGDEPSRRALRDLATLRVLGPYHARLAVSPASFREAQARVDHAHLIESRTFDVSDPWFTPLSRYQMPTRGGQVIELHAHSVELVNVYVLGQYTYACGPVTVGVQPGDVVLDVGGCWGDTALYFADRVGPTGRVYTFEFDPENLHILRTNLALNPELAARIEIVERAVWDEAGATLHFTSAGRCTAIQDSEFRSDNEVHTVTIDAFVRDLGLARVDYIKMDVEGAEARVLDGARRTLADMAPRLGIAAYHRDDDLVDLPDRILAAQGGYTLYLGSYSPIEDETVLFARPTASNSAT